MVKIRLLSDVLSILNQQLIYVVQNFSVTLVVTLILCVKNSIMIKTRERVVIINFVFKNFPQRILRITLFLSVWAKERTKG